MTIDALLKDLTLYIGDSAASKDEKECFLTIVNKLKSSRKVCFIYRGEENLREHYNVDLDNIPLLSHHIFMLGEKGLLFLKEKLKEQDNSFQFIWERFNIKVCNLNFTCENTRQHVSEFLDNNPEIKAYFSNDDNKESFMACEKLSDKERKEVADYYLSLLHTIGRSGNGKSYFLSSSKKKSIAKKFSKFKKEGIILYGWVPKKGINKTTIKYENIDVHDGFIKSLGLPTYGVPVYQDQEEICLKCGWLPHFILGFQYEKDFYINPAALKSWQDSIPYEGLDVDQSKFKEMLNNSNYCHSYIFYDGEYYTILKDEISSI